MVINGQKWQTNLIVSPKMVKYRQNFQIFLRGSQALLVCFIKIAFLLK